MFNMIGLSLTLSDLKHTSLLITGKAGSLSYLVEHQSYSSRDGSWDGFVEHLSQT
jgi:hypothetical protein